MCESEQERLLVSICGLIFKAVSVGEFGPSIGFEREKKIGVVIPRQQSAFIMCETRQFISAEAQSTDAT